MAQYERHIWTAGELITPEKMNNIEGEIERLGQGGILNSITNQYDSSSTYNYGDYVIYNDKLYKIITNGVTGEWDDAQAQELNVIDLLDEVNNSFDDLTDNLEDSSSMVKNAIADEFSSSEDYSIGQYVFYGNALYQFITEHDAGNFDLNEVEQVWMTNQLNHILQDTFSDVYSSTSSYEVGDYVTVGNKLYRCVENAPPNVTLRDYFVETTIGDELKSVIQVREQAGGSASSAEEYALKAEAYAVGTRNGTPVGEEDETYQNNALHYAGLAASDASSAEYLAHEAEAWAIGSRGGETVSAEDPTYHKNAKYWSDHAYLATEEGWEALMSEASSLIEEMEEVTSAANDAAVAANGASAFVSTTIAPAYSTSSTYAAGEYVTYNGGLYRCRTAIGTAEAWTAGHWQAVTFDREVSDLKSATGELISVGGVTASGSGNYYITYYVTNGHKYKITSSSASMISIATKDSNNTTVQSVGGTTSGDNKTLEFTATADAPKVLFYFRAAGTVRIEDISLRVPMLEASVATLESDMESAQDTISTLDTDMDSAQGSISTLESSVDQIATFVEFTDKINRRSNNDYVCMYYQGTLTNSSTAPSCVGTKTYSYLGFTVTNKNNGVFFAKLKVSNIGSVDSTAVKYQTAYNNSPTSPAGVSANGTDTGAGFALAAGSNTTIYQRVTSEYTESEYTGVGIGFLFGTAGITLQIEGKVIDVTNFAYLSDAELKDIIDASPSAYAQLNLPAKSLTDSALTQIQNWPVMSDLLATVDSSIESIKLTNIVNKRASDNQIIVIRNNGTLTGSTTAPSLLGDQTYSYLGLAANNKNNGVFYAKISVKNIGETNAVALRTYVTYNNSPDSSSASSAFGTNIGDPFSLAAGATTTIYHRFSSEYGTSTYTCIAFGVMFGTAGLDIQISGTIVDVTDYASFSDDILKTVVDDADLQGYGLKLQAPNSDKVGGKTLNEVLALAKRENNDYSLIAYGDSLTAGSGSSGVGYRYLDICKNALNALNDKPLGYGGSGSKAIAFTAGAISGFVPPNTRSFALKYSDLSTNISIANTRLNGKVVVIDGNEYTIGQTGNTAYTLPDAYTPASYYKEVVIKDSRYTADIYVIWVGTNDHGMKWDIINALIEKLPHKRYVVMGLTKLGTDTSSEDETKAEELYGSHFFNTRTQIINNAFAVLGETPTAEDTTAMASGLMPPSLLSDETHFNDDGYEAIGKLLAQHIKALGYSYQTAE